MKHRKGYAKLGLPTHRRLSLLRNLFTDLVEHGGLVTTEARAKALRPYSEKLLTKVKKNEPRHRAQLRRVLKTKSAFQKLFEEVRPLLENRPGGYLRVLKGGVPRVGDGARLAFVELVGPLKNNEKESSDTLNVFEDEKMETQEEVFSSVEEPENLIDADSKS